MDAFDNQGSSMIDKQRSSNDHNDERVNQQSLDEIKRQDSEIIRIEYEHADNDIMHSKSELSMVNESIFSDHSNYLR